MRKLFKLFLLLTVILFINCSDFLNRSHHDEETTNPGGDDGPIPDTYEVDNDFSTAKPIVIGGTAQQHTFHVNGDVDYVFVALDENKHYSIQTQFLSIASDTVLTIYDSSENFIESNNDYGANSYSYFHYVPPNSDTYFIKVNEFNNILGDYLISVVEILP